MKEHFITINQAKILYGIAILLMICHHMFGFPERIHVEYDVFFRHNGVPVITILAGACRICVAMYAFVSGYGIMTKVTKKESVNIKENLIQGYQSVLKRLSKFYEVYWAVFIIFIGYGLLTSHIKFDIQQFLKNLIGCNDSYNAEWWYVWQYVRMLLLFPIFSLFICLISLKEKYKNLLFFILIGIETICVSVIHIDSFWRYMFCFLNGMMIFYFNLDTWVCRFCEKKVLSKAIAGMIILFCIGLRLTILGTGEYDFILGIVFSYACLIFLNGEKFIWIHKILQFLGRYSIYLWLMHTFFIYYYFQKYIFAFKYAIIIYIFTLMLMLVVSIVIERVNYKIRTFFYK